MTTPISGSFKVADRGAVSSLLLRRESAHALLVLGHGAGTNLAHPFMQRLAAALAQAGVCSFRFNYPYSESGRGGMDGERVRLETVQAAVAAARDAAPDLPCFVGGHSMSGRMATLAASRGLLEDAAGIVGFAFPLHPWGKPGTARANHLAELSLPALFISGTRDRLADAKLWPDIVASLGASACLHLLDGADHGFKVLKRSGRTHDEMLAEAAAATGDWTATVHSSQAMPTQPWTRGSHRTQE